MNNETPMMKQHKEIKTKYPDTFLFFRCGDFYELFGDDARNAASIMDITLTKRQNTQMCGVPYHSVDLYLNRMIKAGKKVAICEQVEDPATTKGIVKREVVRVVTPGTIVDEKLLSDNANNFLMAVNIENGIIDFSYIDLSTGEFEVRELEFDRELNIFRSELLRISPSEIIIPENILHEYPQINNFLDQFKKTLINRFPLWHFKNNDFMEKMLSHFQMSSINDLTDHSFNSGLYSSSAIFHYVSENVKSVLLHIKKLNYHNSDKTMVLDEFTIRNLELINNLNDNTRNNSFIEVIDNTKTAMGLRLLKKWIIEPLKDKDMIINRQKKVKELFHNGKLLKNISEKLNNIMDLERLLSRVVMDRANPRDLINIKNSLIATNELIEILKESEEFGLYITLFDNLDDLIDIIDNAITDEPSVLLDGGDIVRKGYNTEIDELKDLSFKSKEIMNKIEAEMKTEYNIPSLRIKYNKILGYFFEISKGQSKNVEKLLNDSENSLILRQSLVNVNRYTNKTLSEYESKILTAREKIIEIEKAVFYDIKSKIIDNLEKIQSNSKYISEIDVFQSFGRAAIDNDYTCPEIIDGFNLKIVNGRHPVIEKKLQSDMFIPNDLKMDSDKYIMIVTGPNMSGKSTYLRQNALIVLMAQIGSFVSASEAVLGVVDRIFTRIGTSDNLSRGQSTFFVEMMETADILNNATDNSLIVMDEIGRGTSTYDGMSIAWSVIEYIRNKSTLGAKALFATHYHELTKLDVKEGIKNLSVAVSEEDNNFTFLHKIVSKPAEKSYGIHVAQMANIPQSVITLADKILLSLEDDAKENDKDIIDSVQLELFNDQQINHVNRDDKLFKIINKIKYLDLDRMTPIQSLNYLNKIRDELLSN